MEIMPAAGIPASDEVTGAIAGIETMRLEMGPGRGSVMAHLLQDWCRRAEASASSRGLNSRGGCAAMREACEAKVVLKAGALLVLLSTCVPISLQVHAEDGPKAAAAPAPVRAPVLPAMKAGGISADRVILISGRGAGIVNPRSIAALPRPGPLPLDFCPAR